jgi:hypothetical protein
MGHGQLRPSVPGAFGLGGPGALVAAFRVRLTTPPGADKSGASDDRRRMPASSGQEGGR